MTTGVRGVTSDQGSSGGMSGESWTEIGQGVRMGVSVLEEKFLSACARKDCLSKDLESETSSEWRHQTQA